MKDKCNTHQDFYMVHQKLGYFHGPKMPRENSTRKQVIQNIPLQCFTTWTKTPLPWKKPFPLLNIVDTRDHLLILMRKTLCFK